MAEPIKKIREFKDVDKAVEHSSFKRGFEGLFNSFAQSSIFRSQNFSVTDVSKMSLNEIIHITETDQDTFEKMKSTFQTSVNETILPAARPWLVSLTGLASDYYLGNMSSIAKTLIPGLFDSAGEMWKDTFPSDVAAGTWVLINLREHDQTHFDEKSLEVLQN